MLDPNIAQLESAYQEIVRLQKENLSLLLEMEDLRLQTANKLALAQIESKVYSGIKKLFRYR